MEYKLQLQHGYNTITIQCIISPRTVKYISPWFTFKIQHEMLSFEMWTKYENIEIDHVITAITNGNGDNKNTIATRHK